MVTTEYDRQISVFNIYHSGVYCGTIVTCKLTNVPDVVVRLYKIDQLVH